MPRYIKLIQGTPDAFHKLPRKDEDVVYMIAEEGSADFELYLGSKLIAGKSADKEEIIKTLSALSDVKLSSEVGHDSLLLYDAAAHLWRDKEMTDLVFIGSTNSTPGLVGFVPAPRVKDKDAFLSGSGEWQKIEIPKPIDTYTKQEIDWKVAAAAHMKRKMVNSVADINLHSEIYPDAEQYIYMVPTGFTMADNRYDEYMILPVIDEDGVQISAIERVGTWEVDLSDYAKENEINALQARITDLEQRITFLESVIQGQK